MQCIETAIWRVGSAEAAQRLGTSKQLIRLFFWKRRAGILSMGGKVTKRIEVDSVSR